MNIPNILTSIRLVLVPVFLIVFFSQSERSMLIAFIIFLTAGLTDILDGYIARKFDMITKWGSVLDPLADKLMSITVLVSLTVKEIIPFWILFVISIKEVVMVTGAAILFKKDTYVSSESHGKIATVLLYVSIFTLEFVYRPLGLMLIYTTVFASLYALFKYVDSFKKVQKKLSNK